MPPLTRAAERLLRIAEDARFRELEAAEQAQRQAAEQAAQQQAAAQAAAQAAQAEQAAQQQAAAQAAQAEQAAQQQAAEQAAQQQAAAQAQAAQQAAEQAAQQQAVAQEPQRQAAAQGAQQQAAEAAVQGGQGAQAAGRSPSELARHIQRRAEVFNDTIANTPNHIRFDDGDSFDDNLAAQSRRGPSHDGRWINGGCIDEEFFLAPADGGPYQQVVDEVAFPPLSAGNPLANNSPLLLAPRHLLGRSVFIKRSNWQDIANGRQLAHHIFMLEVFVNDKLAKHPHPHIARYLGVHTRPDGYITGLVFERLPESLQELPYHDFQNIDPDEFFRALQSALAHLHSHGLAYNDLKPENIMVRDGLPYLIDFGSTAVAGARLVGTAYTRGWARPELYDRSEQGLPIFSDRENDVFALNLLRERFTFAGIQTSYS